MNDFAAAEWDRSRRTLESAKTLAENDPDSAASRAYYSAFHAVTACLAIRDLRFSKHSAVRSAIHQYLIKPGLLSKEIGEAFDLLIDLRDTGDYGGTRSVSAKDVTEAIARAELILAALDPLVTPLLRDQPKDS